MNKKAFILKHQIRVIQGQGKRDYQEDSYAHREDLFIVADGMGGHESGKEASRIITESLMEEANTPYTCTRLSILEWVEKAWEHLDQIEVPGNRKQPGTTLAAVWLYGENRYWAAHIGDSRIYHLRPAKVTEICYRSNDDCKVDKMQRDRILTPVEALLHTNRSFIQRAMIAGNRYPVSIDEGEKIEPGDYILCCTDGVLENLTDEMFRFIFAPYRSIDEITDLLKKHFELSDDNHTALIIQFEQSVETDLNQTDCSLDEWSEFIPLSRSLQRDDLLDASLR